MRVCTSSTLAVSLLLCVGCQWYGEHTPRRFLEGDHAANYERVFDSPPPSDIEIINSVVVDYAWRPGVVTTDDWEFEVVAPRTWIDTEVVELGLRRGSDPLILALVEERKGEARRWYAPRPLDSYEVYYLYLTSIPYVHLLVERNALADGRHRVFISKH